MLTGKKVRENPLLEGLLGEGGHVGDEGAAAPGGFGQQQQLQLGKKQFTAAADLDEEDEEVNGEKKQEDLKKKDILSQYTNYTGEFENWEAKKIKILDVFRP